jgi:3-oxoacyl-[acyl-carrier-protein] synthase III
MIPGNLRLHAWTDARTLKFLGSGTALPGPPVSTAELLENIETRFGVAVARKASAVARKLNVRTRHLSRDFLERREAPRKGSGNAELAAASVRMALDEAGMTPDDLAYIVGHTATPEYPLPPNLARVADLLAYQGPFVEIRQACTGFANALIMAAGLLSGPDARPVAIVGSETGSLFFDPMRAAEDSGQLVSLVQMGDAAGAIVLGPVDDKRSAHIRQMFFGQIGYGREPGLRMPEGGSSYPWSERNVLEFEHDFAAIRDAGPSLFVEGIRLAGSMGIDIDAVDWVVPHQANGRMGELLARELGLAEERIFVNANAVGNTGSAAIWTALAELRPQMRPRQTALVLGAEATKFMFGGFLYVHG